MLCLFQEGHYDDKARKPLVATLQHNIGPANLAASEDSYSDQIDVYLSRLGTIKNGKDFRRAAVQQLPVCSSFNVQPDYGFGIRHAQIESPL